MATLTTTTTIQGRINGVSTSITLTSTIEEVSVYLDRAANLNAGHSMQSLNDVTPNAPNMVNAEIAYIRFDTLSGSGDGLHAIDTSASNGLYVADAGQWIELYRAEKGGIFAENTVGTTSVMQVVTQIEQSPMFTSTNVSLLVAFKPIS